MVVVNRQLEEGGANYVIFPLRESVLSSFFGIVTVVCPTPSTPSR